MSRGHLLLPPCLVRPQPSHSTLANLNGTNHVLANVLPAALACLSAYFCCILMVTDQWRVHIHTVDMCLCALTHLFTCTRANVGLSRATAFRCMDQDYREPVGKKKSRTSVSPKDQFTSPTHMHCTFDKLMSSMLHLPRVIPPTENTTYTSWSFVTTFCSETT